MTDRETGTLAKSLTSARVGAISNMRMRAWPLGALSLALATSGAMTASVLPDAVAEVTRTLSPA